MVKCCKYCGRVMTIKRRLGLYCSNNCQDAFIRDDRIITKSFAITNSDELDWWVKELLEFQNIERKQVTPKKIKIDLLDGLDEEQKVVVKRFVRKGR